jgi:ABC-type transport system involved in multi-copper enzyme maturation permease subunit
VRFIKAEILKLRYARRNYGIAVAAMALASLGSGFMPYALSRMKGVVASPLTTTAAVDSVYSRALGAYILAIILGVLMVTSEFHQKTAIATYLAAPKRYQPLVAKLIVASVAGAVMNLIATLVGMGVAVYALTFFPEAVPASSSVWLDNSLIALLTGAILAIIGVGIGSLIRNQSLAVTVSLIWFFIVDRLLAVLFVEVGKWLPTGLISGMMNLTVNVEGSPINVSSEDYLDPWPAAGLLTVYGIVFVVLSLLTTTRRDID